MSTSTLRTTVPSADALPTATAFVPAPSLPAPATGTTPPAAAPAAPGRPRALVLVGDPAPITPGWLPDWVSGGGWEPRWDAGSGPMAAVTAGCGVRVLLLRPTATRDDPPGRRPRVVAALAGLPDDGPVVDDAAGCAARAGAVLTLVHAVPRSFAGRSVGLAGALAHGRRILEAATARVIARAPGTVVDGALSRVRPHELVGEALDADLLVVGGGRPERPEPGLVAHSALHHAPCPVLVVPR